MADALRTPTPSGTTRNPSAVSVHAHPHGHRTRKARPCRKIGVRYTSSADAGRGTRIGGDLGRMGKVSAWNLNIRGGRFISPSTVDVAAFEKTPKMH